jgi:DNA-binding Lrp family transcriptional regulator
MTGAFINQVKAMNDLDKELLNLLQNDFPLCSQPYTKLAAKLKMTEGELLEKIKELKNRGIIRRIGGIIDSRALGFYSTLCACTVAEDQIERVSAVINRLPEVTHNYIRDHNYNLWFTLTAPSKAKCLELIQKIEAESGVIIHSMPAVKMYKIKVSFEMGG